MRKILRLKNPPRIRAYAAVGGKEEASGPLGTLFDLTDPTDRFGMESFERAEGEMERLALNLALKKAELPPSSLDVLFAGDLQNQCVASSGGLFSFGIPFVGLYGACSTLTEGLLSLSVLLSSGLDARLGAVVTSSHNSAAERQFRTPLEYGSQRTPSAQWTATAAGAFLLDAGYRRGPAVTECMVGKIVDGATTDASNMGAAMARAAADTLLSYFSVSGKKCSDFDAVVTGDLGKIGSEILLELCAEGGYNLAGNHRDCGCLLYDEKSQDTHSGASGCGCSAAVLATKILPAMERRELGEVLFLSTGALMSPGSIKQNISICGIAPLVHLSGKETQMLLKALLAALAGAVLVLPAQLLLDKTNLTPARILVLYVVFGVAVGSLGLYLPLRDLFGCGVSVPLFGFGGNVATGVLAEINEKGTIGLFTGSISAASGGTCAAIVFGFLFTILFHAKPKKM